MHVTSVCDLRNVRQLGLKAVLSCDRRYCAFSFILLYLLSESAHVNHFVQEFVFQTFIKFYVILHFA